MPALIRNFEQDDLGEVREIFFESSSRKVFASEEERQSFFYKYVGIYLEHYPQFAFVAVEHRVLGYVLGAPLTNDPALLKVQPHLALFGAWFEIYPAHLHINCHVDARGKGLGKRLVERLEKLVKAIRINGLHIMTGVDAENKNFYLRLGFQVETVQNFHGSEILLMGKKLSDDKL